MIKCAGQRIDFLVADANLASSDFVIPASHGVDSVNDLVYDTLDELLEPASPAEPYLYFHAADRDDQQALALHLIKGCVPPDVLERLRAVRAVRAVRPAAEGWRCEFDSYRPGDEKKLANVGFDGESKKPPRGDGGGLAAVGVDISTYGFAVDRARQIGATTA
ncbi:hypothetical protein CYMTET_39363 [Cymbomonas tetramitiformis]|uniref:Uncharacterized protein n=1 Tax=Cymbomonas tetramitiformis TaxID=36881 RepID=A0AAE0CA85_9CHLO|nr:hypothetical protein CYMTET_39363 [Cymbomonas tetramitiformis]